MQRSITLFLFCTLNIRAANPFNDLKPPEVVENKLRTLSTTLHLTPQNVVCYAGLKVLLEKQNDGNDQDEKDAVGFSY